MKSRVIWLVFGVAFSVSLALIVGRLTDGTRYQSEDTIKVTGCH